MNLQAHFLDEKIAFDHLESLLWPDGVTCPHCGTVDRAGKLNGVKGKTGKPRYGLWKCYECRRQFTVKVGTVFDGAHIPMNKILYAAHLMSDPQTIPSVTELHRTLGITYKSTWWLAQHLHGPLRVPQ